MGSPHDSATPLIDGIALQYVPMPPCRLSARLLSNAMISEGIVMNTDPDVVEAGEGEGVWSCRILHGELTRHSKVLEWDTRAVERVEVYSVMVARGLSQRSKARGIAAGVSNRISQEHVPPQVDDAKQHDVRKWA